MELESAKPVLRVSDYPAARRFYTDVLGFSPVEEAGEPTGFGIYVRDKASVFLIAYDGPEAAYDKWRVYIHVKDIEDLARQIEANGGILTSGLTTTGYGMREIEIADPDGNVICFGEDA